MNKHKFELKLPMDPMVEDTMLKMDGKDLSGVTRLLLRAGVEGYTNVVIEFEPKVLAEFISHAIFKAEGFEGNEVLMVDIAERFFKAAEGSLSQSTIAELREEGYQEIACFVQRLMDTMAEAAL